ncbi:MAG: hypothetical protein QOJ64_1535 [Acidobacteriota bacterium]|jgi:hypothetical protein|nr:hypothetical protein [Acidobacteriota bacterium]
MDVKEIEVAISQLPPTAVAELAEWFEEFHARIWDLQIEEDSKKGRLDSLVSEAAQEFESGPCEPL